MSEPRRVPWRVLIVPPEFLLVDVGHSILDRRLIRVRTARHAAEALSICKAWSPDAVVLTNALRGSSPREFCTAIRRHEATSGALPCKLILVSQQLESSGDDDALVDVHLISPVEQEQLLATLASVLDVRQRRAPRVTTGVLATLEGPLDDDGATRRGRATVISLSAVGACIEASEILQPGTALRMVFVFAQQRFDLQARVLQPTDEVALHYAVEFVAVDGAPLEPLEKCVARELAARSGRRA